MLLEERNVPLREALMMISNYEEALALMDETFATL